MCVAAVAHAAPQQPPAAALPAGAGVETVRTRCLGCHGAQPIVQQKLGREGWTRELDKMAGWGAAFDVKERGVMLDYLATHFGPVASPPAAPQNGDRGATLLKGRCTACHDGGLIEQQRLTGDGWRRELDKMIGWGATLNQEEREVLAAYLSRRYPVSGTR